MLADEAVAVDGGDLFEVGEGGGVRVEGCLVVALVLHVAGVVVGLLVPVDVLRDGGGFLLFLPFDVSGGCLVLRSDSLASSILCLID